MQGHKVYALLCLVADGVKERVRIQIHHISGSADRLINWDGADRNFQLENLAPHCPQVSAGREVHNRICTVCDCRLRFFNFCLRRAVDTGRSDIHVDLHRRAVADSTGCVGAAVIFQHNAASGANIPRKTFYGDVFLLCDICNRGEVTCRKRFEYVVHSLENNFC